MAKKHDWIIGGLLLGSIAIVGFLFILMFIGLGSSADLDVSGPGPKIAIVEFEGIITSSKTVIKQFKKFDKDDAVKAIVFHINSPGGGIAPSQEIYEYVKKVRDGGKPVIASMGAVAASGGYYIALGADTIMANYGTTTGSIGVIAEIPNYHKLLDKIGVSFTVIKSGEFKDTGSPHRPATERDLKYLQSWIDSGYDQFVDAIINERGMSRENVLKVADGRVYTGQQALTYGLIDTIGTFEDAVQFAGELTGLGKNPKTIKESPHKMTLLELLTTDIEGYLHNKIGLWPRARYILSF